MNGGCSSVNSFVMIGPQMCERPSYRLRPYRRELPWTARGTSLQMVALLQMAASLQMVASMLAISRACALRLDSGRRMGHLVMWACGEGVWPHSRLLRCALRVFWSAQFTQLCVCERKNSRESPHVQLVSGFCLVKEYAGQGGVRMVTGWSALSLCARSMAAVPLWRSLFQEFPSFARIWACLNLR